jgi:hypothetical protein
MLLQRFLAVLHAPPLTALPVLWMTLLLFAALSLRAGWVQPGGTVWSTHDMLHYMLLACH